jgi:putative DNA primase/helicase
MNAHRVSFVEARAIAIDHGKLAGSAYRESRPTSAYTQPVEIAKPTNRVLALLRESCAVEDCDAAIIYLRSRGLWPLPKGHGLKAHPSVEYWQDSQSIGRYPALVAGVRDMCGELVTVHVTYLQETGEKLQGFEPRKLLSGMSGREGCAVPLMRMGGDALGIAEGIETALAAATMHGMPVWAALNTSLLQKFEPPEKINKLVIFADRDVAGLDAAAKLMQRLQEKVRLEIRTPQVKDWNDALMGAA